MPSTKCVTQWKIQKYMLHSHQVLCLACQESSLTPQVLQHYLSKPPHGLTPATQEHYFQAYTLWGQPKNLPEPNGVNSMPSKVMMMMTMMMMTISSTTNHPSTISALLMNVMNSFLLVPTMIITSMTTCHQISFAKMKKQIPHLRGTAHQFGWELPLPISFTPKSPVCIHICHLCTY